MRTNYPKHLPGFSYIGCYAYSLTFCTRDRARLFTMTESVCLVRSQILRAAESESFNVTAYCFMPDHLHLVVEGGRDDSDLKAFVKLAKQLSGFHYKQKTGNGLWQRYSFEHVLRDSEDLALKVRYVLDNPVRAGLVAAPADYPYLGSGVYELDELFDFAYGRRGAGEAWSV